LKKALVVVDQDPPFRSWCRLQQSLYRQRHGWECGLGGQRRRPIGNYLTPADAAAGKNFLSPAIHAAALRRLADREERDVIEPDRLMHNLLTSQTMCFNLFLPQVEDIQLASVIWRAMLPDTVRQVTKVRLEHSPGRGDLRFTGDHSAFDACIEFIHRDGSGGLLAIETKYTDSFSPSPGLPTKRLNELAATSGLFSDDGWRSLQGLPTQQLWRTHLLAESLRNDQCRHVTYVVLHVAGDTECSAVLPAYYAALSDRARLEERFMHWTVECFVCKSLAAIGPSDWLTEFHGRYLDWSAVASELVAG
jgi:hypothetical protein